MTEQTNAMVAIRFHELEKLYNFDASNVSDLEVGDFVIVPTSRGREMGRVAGFVSDRTSRRGRKLKTVERRATARDLVVRRLWQQRELERLIDCREEAARLGIKGVKFVKADYSFDGARLTFQYHIPGDEKVDLKDLRQAMRRKVRKASIDMRQIGPRDLAKVIGGLGSCGLEERCCSKFLSEFSPVSIKMAKAQGVSLNPQEITGMCGRLRCCLVYEFRQYAEANKQLPKLKKRVITPHGEGKVVSIQAMKGAVTVVLDDGKRVDVEKQDLQPYKELKALKEKASAPCERHSNGECDCAKS